MHKLERAPIGIGLLQCTALGLPAPAAPPTSSSDSSLFTVILVPRLENASCEQRQRSGGIRSTASSPVADLLGLVRWPEEHHMTWHERESGRQCPRTWTIRNEWTRLTDRSSVRPTDRAADDADKLEENGQIQMDSASRRLVSFVIILRLRLVQQPGRRKSALMHTKLPVA